MRKVLMMGIALAALAVAPLSAGCRDGSCGDRSRHTTASNGGMGNGGQMDGGYQEDTRGEGGCHQVGQWRDKPEGCGVGCGLGGGECSSCPDACDGSNWLCADCDSCVDPCCPFGYARGYIGISWVWDSENQHPAGPVYKSHFSYDAGWVGTGAVGHQFGSGVAVELEAGFRRNLLDKLKFNGSTYKGQGEAEVVSGMLNGLYHFCLDGHYVPFVGVGIGFAETTVKVNNLEITSSNDFPINDDDFNFAWQVLAGVNYEMCCGYDLQLEYRYFGTHDPRLFSVNGIKVRTEMNMHSVGLGVRWRFN